MTRIVTGILTFEVESLTIVYGHGMETTLIMGEPINDITNFNYWFEVTGPVKIEWRET